MGELWLRRESFGAPEASFTGMALNAGSARVFPIGFRRVATAKFIGELPGFGRMPAIISPLSLEPLRLRTSTLSKGRSPLREALSELPPFRAEILVTTLLAWARGVNPRDGRPPEYGISAPLSGEYNIGRRGKGDTARRGLMRPRRPFA